MGYKEEKEAFVTGHTGTSPLEVTAILLYTITLPMLFYSLQRLLKPSEETLKGFKWFLLEFGIRCFGGVFVVTIAIDYCGFILIASFAVSGIIQFWAKMKERGKKQKNEEEKKNKTTMTTSQFPFISEYRSAIMNSTVIAILAVDFPLLPRRLAKTEEFGYSSMDCGVAFFIISAGLICPVARGKTKSSFLKILKSMSPLLVLGFARFFSVRSADYQVHVSEYGVHWNFFFTLAFSTAIAFMIVQILPNVPPMAIGIFLITVYQFFLLATPLSDYILNGPRLSFFSANREGILSLIGYVSLFMISIHYGRIIWLMQKKSEKDGSFELLKTFLRDALLFLILASVMETHCQPASRRLLNGTYCAFVLGVNLLVLAGEVWMQRVIMRGEPSYFAQAVNRNQLALFLFANVMTGVIGYMLKTIYTPNMIALAVMTGYLFTYAVGAWALERYHIQLKYW